MFGEEEEEEEQCVCVGARAPQLDLVARSQPNAPGKSDEEVSDGGNRQSTWWFDQAGGEDYI